MIPDYPRTTWCRRDRGRWSVPRCRASVVIDNAPAQEFVAANPGLKILDTAYAQEDYAIGVAKGNTQLLDAINGALEELQDDGTLQAIVNKYITAE